jgi:RHS repeat-associated protein
MISIGSTVKSYKYDAFGNILQETGPTINRGFTYTSRPWHGRSGLYYYRARWYSPELGRFLTPDPVGPSGGVNLYAYVRNDPTNFFDPWGLTQMDIDVATEVIKEMQTDLRFPETVDPSWKSEKYDAQYMYFTDTIKLNEDFLKELTDQEATNLLNTLIHETLHANDPVWKQLLDSFFSHPGTFSEADRRTDEILEMYLKKRKQAQ